MKTKITLAILILTCVVINLEAANHYVRAAATGNYNGNDWTNAYTALPASLIRGDAYYIADGSYGNLTLSSAVGSGVITIKKAISSDHGTETGWNSTYGDDVAFWSDITMNASDVVFDGQTGAERTGYGFECSSMSFGANNITIKYCNIHPYPEGTPKDNMTNYSHAVNMQNCSQIVFSHCYIHHMFGCPFLWRNNTSIIVEYCFLANNRNTAAFHSEGISDDGSDNVIIRYNKWCDIEGTGFIALITGSGSVANTWDIYGNVFWHTGTFGSTVSAVITVVKDASNDVTANNWKIYNNTFATINGTPALSFNSSTTLNVQIRNNLFWQNRQNQSYTDYIYIDIGGSGSSSDYSYYGLSAFPFTMSNTSNENLIYDGPNCRLSDAPGFPGFMNPANGNFHLNGPITGYPGQTLTSSFNTDIEGNTRGADGVWDRGAYEYTDVNSVSFTDPLPENFKLYQNYPNPFNPSTTLSFVIGHSSFVSLKIYDMLGNEVVTLVDEYKPAGNYEVEFNAYSHSGKVRNLPSGVYFYQLQSGDFISTKSMVMIK